MDSPLAIRDNVHMLPRIACSLLAVIVTACGEVAKIRADREPSPHVLLLTVDTLRPDYLSSTPTLDRLIAQGVYFERAVTPIPRTSQALASMMTGTYPHTTGVRRLFDSLRHDVVPLAVLAHEAGYRTLAVVSNHVLAPQGGLGRGFEVYDAAGDSRDAAATSAAAMQLLSGVTSDPRIFAWVHYVDPHVPYFPPQGHARQFDPGYQGRYALNFGQVIGGLGDAAYPEDLPKREAVFHNALPEEVNAHVRRLYAADIRSTDDAIGTLLRWIRGRFADDWLILFAADHGESLGEHDFYFDHGDYVYQATLRVPLAVVLPSSDPWARSGRYSGDVSLLDVMPTLAELMGLTVPSTLPYEIEGRSLVPALLGETLPDRPTFAESGMAYFPHDVKGRSRFDIAGRFRSVTDGRYKLIWTPGSEQRHSYELFDLEADPDETHGLQIEAHREFARLKGLLHRWLRVPTQQPQGPSEDDLAVLRSLGYVE